MLMKWRHDPRSDIRAPGHRRPELLIIKRNRTQDPRGPHLKLNIRRLVEDKRENILVVTDRANHLHNELSVPYDGCSARAVVCVFVLEAVVLLVQADDVLQVDGVPFAVAAVAVEVFDVA
jgi:hypothetical protein